MNKFYFQNQVGTVSNGQLMINNYKLDLSNIYSIEVIHANNFTLNILFFIGSLFIIFLSTFFLKNNFVFFSCLFFCTVLILLAALLKQKNLTLKISLFDRKDVLVKVDEMQRVDIDMLIESVSNYRTFSLTQIGLANFTHIES